jgi:Phophatidylserine decarboxylase
MTTGSDVVDVRRRAGWLPHDQDDLEAWLAGHRERVKTRGEQVVLHPVLTEFEELINTDPVVRMYVNRMIAEVPRSKHYRERHLQSVTQLLRLINEVLSTAPEFGNNAVVTPLGAILDWTMGTPAGFAAFRDPRINAMLKKILTVSARSSTVIANMITMTMLESRVGAGPHVCLMTLATWLTRLARGWDWRPSTSAVSNKRSAT